MGCTDCKAVKAKKIDDKSIQHLESVKKKDENEHETNIMVPVSDAITQKNNDQQTQNIIHPKISSSVGVVPQPSATPATPQLKCIQYDI